MSGGGEAVCVDEAAEVGVVIAALQVIESQLLGKGLAEMKKRLLFLAKRDKNMCRFTIWTIRLEYP